MKFTAEQIAGLLHGEVVGNPSEAIHGVSKIEEGQPGTLAFLANPKYTHFIYTTKASVVLVNTTFVPDSPIAATLIKVADAYRAIAQLLEMYEQMQPQKTGIEQPSFVHASATIGEFPYVGAFAYIGENCKIGNNVKIYPQVYVGDNVTVGDNTILYAGVKIYKQCKIGNNCIVHSGAVVGSDGFGFAPDENNVYKKIPQIGNVVIGNNVEIGANTTLDRATMGSTIVRDGAKLDNLVQIAHNVEIGSNTVIAAQTGIAGSAKIGSEAMIGGQVGIAGHISLADGIKIGAQAGVGSTITEKGVMLMGSPAFDLRSFHKAHIVFKKLPEIYAQLNRIEKELNKKQ